MPTVRTRAAVLGSPVSHSLSPALHRAAYASLDLTQHRYDRFEVGEADLPGFLGALDIDGEGWAGLSLTMPLKRAVVPLLDKISDTALAVDAVNTVLFTADGRRAGDNTDVPGLLSALAERGVTRVESASLLGGGATASSALAALARICTGAVTAYVRGPARAVQMRALGERLGVTVHTADWAHASEAFAAPLTVSTTPVGATDHLAPRVPYRPGVLFDVLYHPWPTVLADAWCQRGGAVLGGLDLLVHQAVRQCEMFTGIAPGPLAAMRAAAQGALAGPGARPDLPGTLTHRITR